MLNDWKLDVMESLATRIAEAVAKKSVVTFSLRQWTMLSTILMEAEGYQV